VIFGGAGDLARRKLFPALVHLRSRGLLSDAFAVITVGRESMTDDGFRAQLEGDLRSFVSGDPDGALSRWLLERVHCVAGDFRSAETYAQLAERLDQIGRERDAAGKYVFYLATPPAFFADIVEQLDAAKLARAQGGGWRRVVIEKPFGHDLASAQALNRQLKAVLDESQIFRIDHYLGKETVQNLLVLRFANGIFEPIWNRNYIDHVQITVAETLGVERRADYYETAGALKDMVPNHLFQLLALTTMEPPSSFEAGAVRNEMCEALDAVPLLSDDRVLTQAVRGQYGGGRVGDGVLPAYRDEPGVSASSTTETFVALKLEVDNWRWADVPFYLRTGKRLAQRATEIVIRFKRAPAALFRKTQVDAIAPNELVVRIQPDEGISLGFQARVPGPLVRLGDVEMSFAYADRFGVAPSTGYETLLYDAMNGDATLFQRSDMVEAGWRIVGPILDVWKALAPREFPNYAAGSWGPKQAEDLLARDGRAWRNAP
jgi:glucose-6-phosphate 1-dehydrogenase